MTDHAEEQEMEAEALQAIFDTHFTILEPQKWQIEIYPEMTADAEELNELNHVGVHLIAQLPDNYPEALPVLECQIIKGLVEEHREELLTLAQEEAAANEGVPSIFAIAERLREWLAENNQKGLDDLSMHAQMLRKQQAKEKEVSAIGIQCRSILAFCNSIIIFMVTFLRHRSNPPRSKCRLRVAIIDPWHGQDPIFNWSLSGIAAKAVQYVWFLWDWWDNNHATAIYVYASNFSIVHV